MKITDFTANHIEQATVLAKQNYAEARGFVPALPRVDALPDLSEFAENNMGIAAFEGDKMTGFLCAYVFDNAFGITDVRGVWSPIHANAAAGDKNRIYQRLYQSAAEKWAAAGVLSHAVTLYAHEQTAIQALFNYGFGLRCVDAIKRIETTGRNSIEAFEFSELPREEAGGITALLNASRAHMGKSPCFMSVPPASEAEVVDFVVRQGARIFIARHQKTIIAFLQIVASGENFVCDASDMMNICGAYLLPEYRGKGVFDGLLGYAEAILAQDGYRRIGVDFESFNPTALGFWLKHFTAYTRSVVRRIAENVK